MRICTIVICLTLFCLAGRAQNLVVNGSFENHSGIDCSSGSYTVVNNWMPISSPDYFNAVCTSTFYATPVNRFGNQYPINGFAYTGIICFISGYEIKEYIYQQLISPLIAGKSYYLSFYTSRSERDPMGIKNIGALLSISQPTTTPDCIIATPQVEWQSGTITDTSGWTKIEGYFVASGGEQYITIGNFHSNANTDTIYIGTNDPLPGNPVPAAYYYIDSVSLYDSMTVGIDELPESQRFNLYPNPSNGTMQLDYRITEKAELVITDMMGNEVEHLPLEASRTTILLDETKLLAGTYFYSIKSGPALLKQGKLMIIK